MISLPPIGLGSTQIYPWILWLLWTNRNQFVFENRVFSEELTVLKAIRDAKAWQAAQTFVSKPAIPQFVVVSPLAPATNSFTWSTFSDAAWDQETGNCGLDWQLRDSGNSIAESSSSYRRFVPSALVADALAVKTAVASAVSHHVSNLIVNSDSKNLVLLLKSKGQNTNLRGVLHDIYVLSRPLISISYHFVPRLANAQADTLAKTALSVFASSASIVD
ncbi:hypothetical protein Bca101_041497 [Brassica carinata]